jgi:hypothetical protein
VFFNIVLRITKVYQMAGKKAPSTLKFYWVVVDNWLMYLKYGEDTSFTLSMEHMQCILNALDSRRNDLKREWNSSNNELDGSLDEKGKRCHGDRNIWILGNGCTKRYVMDKIWKGWEGGTEGKAMTGNGKSLVSESLITSTTT